MSVITCPTCQESLSINPKILPKQVVTFACPLCKGKITYDNRSADTRMTTSNITLQPAPKEVLAKVALSKRNRAMVVVQKADWAPLIKAGLENIGMEVLETLTDLPKAVEVVGERLPNLCFLVLPSLGSPPAEALKPFNLLSPQDRRLSFIGVMAPNVKTLDGNAAFIHGVNCLISSNDIDRFHHFLLEAYQDHLRLYRSVFELEGR